MIAHWEYITNRIANGSESGNEREENINMADDKPNERQPPASEKNSSSSDDDGW